MAQTQTVRPAPLDDDLGWAETESLGSSVSHNSHILVKMAAGRNKPLRRDSGRMDLGDETDLLDEMELPDLMDFALWRGR